jgi:hypothetical protein
MDLLGRARSALFRRLSNPVPPPADWSFRGATLIIAFGALTFSGLSYCHNLARDQADREQALPALSLEISPSATPTGLREGSLTIRNFRLQHAVVVTRVRAVEPSGLLLGFVGRCEPGCGPDEPFTEIRTPRLVVPADTGGVLQIRVAIPNAPTNLEAEFAGQLDVTMVEQGVPPREFTRPVRFTVPLDGSR